MKLIRKIIDYIRHDIWQKSETEYASRKQRWAVRQFKVVLFASRSFLQHDTAFRAAALSFYTVMSLVPVLALIFAIVKGFGLEANLNDHIHEQFPQYSAVIDQIFVFTENLLSRTRGGVMAISGFFVLIWAVLQVFSNVERSFNQVWEIKRQRPFALKLSDYIVVVFIAPVLWLISNGIIVSFKTRLAYYSGSVLADMLFGFVSLVAIWLMFSLTYFLMPNTQVKLRSAVWAGVVAGTAFQLFQVGYVWVQSNLSAYNAIYGTFAAIPLFLLWLQISWQILLFGAELSFGHQNIKRYEQEREALLVSYDNRCKVMLAAMLVVARNFLNGAVTSTTAQVADTLNLPIRLVAEVIFDLEQAGLLLAVRNEQEDKLNEYIPARDVHELRLLDVTEAVRSYGKTPVDLRSDPWLREISERYDRICEQEQGSPDNVLLTALL